MTQKLSITHRLAAFHEDTNQLIHWQQQWEQTLVLYDEAHRVSLLLQAS